ncbi:hypothetical protein ACRQF6_08865 [Actinotignum sp. GS-2025f]|uniref:hypothetical protein n=1 Tax=Actinotignum TaxID=1653174 RepID=UPI002A802F71|nr:hypothetical protein [Actinotignum timonense]MDY5145299.1 hypothetical protein [Actinotignum timonense]
MTIISSRARILPTTYKKEENVNRPVFKVRAERSGKQWHLECHAVDHVSECPKLDQAEEVIRHAIASQTGLAADSFDTSIDVILPEGFDIRIAETYRLRHEAEELTRQAAAQTRSIALDLKENGLTLRDIGAILGVSYQRAGQLTKG